MSCPAMPLCKKQKDAAIVFSVNARLGPLLVNLVQQLAEQSACERHWGPFTHFIWEFTTP